ncbi:MAG: hypothetical protein Q9221_005932 [Calogaya cf. arnoldii]
MRAKVKWVLDRKKVSEIIQSLDSHQITLILALQSFAQRNGIEIHSDLIGRLDQLGRRHEDTARNIREELILGNAKLHADLTSLTQTSQALSPAQESLGSRMTDLHKTVSAGQTTILDRINALGTSPSHTQIRSNHVQSSTILTVPTEDVLARVFRAELQRVIVPTVQQCFDTFKANSDPQVEEIKKTIDEMAQQLGSRSCGNERHSVEPMNNTSQTSDTQRLIHFRGLELSVGSKSDQRGFYQICPFLSTFAIVPEDAEIFRFVRANKIEGI